MTTKKSKTSLKASELTVAVVSGGFDPVQAGHIELFKEAKANADLLLVYLNSDEWLTRKKGHPFMDQCHRMKIINALQYVDIVFPLSADDDADDTAKQALIKTRSIFTKEEHHIMFMNGGDRGKGNVPEDAVADELGIEMVYGVGGNYKIHSSSWLLNDWVKNASK